MKNLKIYSMGTCCPWFRFTSPSKEKNPHNVILQTFFHTKDSRIVGPFLGTTRRNRFYLYSDTNLHFSFKRKNPRKCYSPKFLSSESYHKSDLFDTARRNRFITQITYLNREENREPAEHALRMSFRMNAWKKHKKIINFILLPLNPHVLG